MNNSEKISNKLRTYLYTTMRRIRFFEEKIIEHYPDQQMRTPVHLYIGQEAIAAGVCEHLEKEDLIFSTHRNHGHCLAKGMDFYRLLAEFHGKKTGCSGGKGGSMHPAAPDIGIPGTTAIVGGNIPLAVGAGWTNLFKNNGKVSVAFFGDGACEEGTFHESLGFAALKKIPVLFVCENNLYATASHISQRQPTNPGIADRARAYGIKTSIIDGNNVEAVWKACHEMVTGIRSGEGPFFLEASTYRWKSHVGPTDDTETGHRPKPELQQWQKFCPIKTYRQYLTTNGIWSDHLEQTLIKQLEDEFSSALQRAKQDPFPDESNFSQFVYQE